MTRLTDDSDYNPDFNLINNSGKDILILNAKDMVSNTTSAAPQMMYEQTLTPLTLKNTSDTILKAGSTGIITLNDTYTDDQGQPQTSLIYELILADPSDLSPIKNLVQDYNEPDYFADPPTPGHYSDVTVSDDDAKQMSKALEFLQVISAYPSSDLAKGFVAALKSTDGKAISDQESTMKTFFLGTTGYTQVDFPAYVLASTYQSTYAARWYPPSTDVPYNTDHSVSAHTEYSYWLYSSANMGGGSGGATKASCLGKVMFLNGPTGTPNDHSSGMAVYFTTNWWMSPATTDKALLFDKGQFVDQVTDIPGIALQMTWAVKGTFTNDASDSTLWPIMVGTVGNEDVIGLPMHAEDGWDKFGDFWSELTFQSVLSYFLTLMGVLMAIDFIKTKVQERINAGKEKKANQNKGKDLSLEQEDEVNKLADKTGDAARTVKLKLAARLGKDSATNQPKVDVPTADQVPPAQEQVAQAGIETDSQRAVASARDAISKFEDQLQQLGGISNDDLVQDAGGDLLQANISLEDAMSTKSYDFSGVTINLSKGQGKIDELIKKLGGELDSEVQQIVNNAKEALKTMTDVSRETQESIEDTETGEIPKEL